jgi:hypothetical protein
VNLSSASRRHAAAAALLTAAVLIVMAARADAATMKSAAFRPPVLETKWALSSGDCAGSVSLSDSPSVDSYGFFSGWHATWGGNNCLATSNARELEVKSSTYQLLGHRLVPGIYYVQVEYCHDSDFSGSHGNWFCRGSNVLGVRIPSPVAGTLSGVKGTVLVNGERARDTRPLYYGDELRTGAGSEATVDRSGGGELKLRAGTAFVPVGPASARLRAGKLKANVDRYLRVSTPNAAAAVTRGVFKLFARRSSSRDRTFDGTVAFGNTRGTRRTVEVRAGYESVVRGSNPPTAPARFSPGG